MKKDTVSVRETNLLSYAQRALLCKNKTARMIFETMERKKSNLGIAADLTTSAALYDLIERVGSFVCMVKTHSDIIEDFDESVSEKLRYYAAQYDFILFEDRKFADIGTTVALQYAKGVHRIVEWADVVNAHIIAGPESIESLRAVGLPYERALLLIAQMSSKGSIAHNAYTHTAVAYAQQYDDFVIGFISQQKLLDEPRFIHITPGVRLKEGSGVLGQQYKTPDFIIRACKSDIILVGQDIYRAFNPAQKAKKYQHEGWKAYEKNIRC